MEEDLNIRASCSFPSRLGSEKKAMRFAESFVEQMSFCKERIEDIKTLVAEAALNAMEHGNAMDDTLFYELELWMKQKGELIIRIYDRGGAKRWKSLLPFRPISAVMETDSETRGWGLQIVDCLADDWEFHVEEDGTCLEIKVIG